MKHWDFSVVICLYKVLQYNVVLHAGRNNTIRNPYMTKLILMKQ